jgi:hypothetical protein
MGSNPLAGTNKINSLGYDKASDIFPEIGSGKIMGRSARAPKPDSRAGDAMMAPRLKETPRNAEGKTNAHGIHVNRSAIDETVEWPGSG